MSVRWLSLTKSLQYLYRAYKATKNVLPKNDKQFNIDWDGLKWLIHLLFPFQMMIRGVQTGGKSSLYYALLSILSLRHILSLAEEL